MSTSIKISANTSEVKKSLLEISREVKNLGKSKVSVFSMEDRKFMKGELKQELALMKQKLASNRSEIQKMVKEQAKLEKGTKDELEHRKKILESYRTQAQLASQMERLQKQNASMGQFGGGGIGGMLSKLGSLLAGGALAVGGMAIVRGYQANSQYQQGVGNRVRLRGLGQDGSNVGSPEELARAGLTEQDFIERQMRATGRLGRAGGSRESLMQQARFERSFGLEGGSMTNIAGSLRGSFGGKGADVAQSKLQASIFASGIEDAIGPYLEAATDLLADINKNGITNTDEMIRILAEFTKDGRRTPEQIAEAFKGIDSAVRGSSGEANAFLQTAFSRGGIGGGTIGATRLAMSSGGVMGLNEDELLGRGYNPGLVSNMKGAGFMSGVGGRSGAMLNQFKQSAGVKGNISDITDINTMTGLATMSNSVFGTQGMGGFDALQMMEKVQNKQMTQKQFDQKLQEIRDGKDPSVQRLDKINSSLEGQTDVLNKINTNLMENLGKSTVKVANIATEADNALVQGTGNVAGAVSNTGALDAGLTGAKSLRQNLVGGGLGDKIYDLLHPSERLAREGNFPSPIPMNITTDQGKVLEDAVKNGMKSALLSQKAQAVQNTNRVNVRIQNGDGTISNKTHK